MFIMKRDSQSIQFILERIYKGWNIDAYQYSKDNQLCIFSGNGDKKAKPVEPGVERLEFFRISCRQKQYPVIFMEEHMVYFLAFLDEEDSVYVFGPASVETLSFGEILSYRRRCGIAQQNYQIPVISPLAALSLLSMAYFMITGNQVSEEQLLEQNHVFSKFSQKDMLVYEYSRDSEEKHRLAYKEEMRWIKSIEEGIVESRDQSLTPENIKKLQDVGTMVENNSLKQMEYMLVTAATLASRAAIRGGMNTHEAYNLSDLYFQRISKCTDVVELLNVYLQLTDDFSRQVKKSKETRSSDLIEQCKSYIARHLRQKISLQEIADETGKSRSYLSRKFSKEAGISIQDYILDQRLQAAANMLKFSDFEIADIAEYLCFSSQSYFGERFKKKYGVTPRQYRLTNKIIDFKSN